MKTLDAAKAVSYTQLNEETMQEPSLGQMLKQKLDASKQIGGDHYLGTIQPWDAIIAWGLDPWSANVVKYIQRFPKKNGKQDLEKALHYLEYLIQNYDTIRTKYYKE